MSPTPGSLVVDADGTMLSYTDTGAPADPGYITIIAINGLGFNAHIFTRVQLAARAAGFRFVAVNRRGYGSSTPLAAAQHSVITEGSPEDKEKLWKTLAIQLLTFIDAFATQERIAPISDDRNTGGLVVIGWSFGNTLTVPAIAQINAVPDDVRARLAARIRALILHEPPSNSLGMSLPPQTWLPHANTQFPAQAKTPLFSQWITSYFDHDPAALAAPDDKTQASRSPDALEFYVPSFTTPPSVWTDPSAFAPARAPEPPVIIDAQTGGAMNDVLGTAYGALFDRDGPVRTKLPHMRVRYWAGTRTAAFLVCCLWNAQERAKKAAAGGEQVMEFHITEGTNHFVFWDKPEEAIEIYRELVA